VCFVPNGTDPKNEKVSFRACNGVAFVRIRSSALRFYKHEAFGLVFCKTKFKHILVLKGPKNFAEGEAFLKIIWPFSQNG